MRVRGCHAGRSTGWPCPVGQPGMGSAGGGAGPWMVPMVSPIPAFPTPCSSHLLDIGEAVVAFQGRGDADGSVHAQGVFLQAAGGRGVRQHQPGRCGHQQRMHGLGIGKATHSGFALLRTTGLAIPSLFPKGMSGKAAPGSPWEWDTHLRWRRLRFTFSALAMAWAPATPMEFPRRLQTKAGVRKDSLGWPQTGGGGEVTAHSESRARQARPGRPPCQGRSSAEPRARLSDTPGNSGTAVGTWWPHGALTPGTAGSC